MMARVLDEISLPPCNCGVCQCQLGIRCYTSACYAYEPHGMPSPIGPIQSEVRR